MNMATDWQIEVLHVDETVDGARLYYVDMRHSSSSLSVSGFVASYESEHPFTDELEGDALLPTALVRRLLTKLYAVYSVSVGEYGDSGIISPLDLHVFIDGQYPPDDAAFLKRMIDRL